MAVEKHLPQDQFDSVIRWIKRADVDRLNQLAVAANASLQRLGLRACRRKSVKGTPKGSDHYDSGSIKDWMDKISKEDAEAVEQLLQIQATVKARQG